MCIQKQDRKRARAVMKQFEIDEAERAQKKKDEAWTIREELVFIRGNPDAMQRGMRV